MKTKSKIGNAKTITARPPAVVADAILTGVAVSRNEVRQLAIGYQMLSKLVGDKSSEHAQFHASAQRHLSHLKVSFDHLRDANQMVNSVARADRDKTITEVAALTWNRAGNFVHSVSERLFPVNTSQPLAREEE